MIFAHDTELALQYAAALVNTRPTATSPEGLPNIEDLLAHLQEWDGWTGSMPRTDADLAQVLRVRDRLARLWVVDVQEAVAIVNTLLRDGRALPQLVTHEPLGWHIHGTPDDAPFAIRLAVEAAFGMVDVIRTDSLDRLEHCAGLDCDHVLVDLTKNRSRKYCDTACANKAHAAAYRARKASR